MRSGLLTTLALVVVGLVGGVTFMKNWVPSKTSSAEDAPLAEKDGPSEVRVNFPVTVTTGIPEYEVHGTGHYDFWFKNANPQSVDFLVNWKSCKCSSIDVLALRPGEEERFKKELPPAAAAAVAAGAGGCLATLPAVAATEAEIFSFLRPSDRWHRLEVGQGDSDIPSVPAGVSGIVRLHWEGRVLGPLRITGKLQFQAHGDPRTRGGETSLEVPICVVPALRISNDDLRIGELDLNRKDTQTQCYCWSSTRASFNLTVREKSGDPCVACAVEPLEGEDFRQAAAEINKGREIPTHPLAIHLVTTSVHTHTPTRDLDLGPLKRFLEFRSDLVEAEPLSATITGMVRGELAIGTPDDRDCVMLRVFPADDGITITTPITTNQPGLHLDVEGKTPDFLVVRLEEKADADGLARWDLVVTVPPNSVTGKLPADSAIVLRTRGAGSRRVRIPIMGKATIALGH